MSEHDVRLADRVRTRGVLGPDDAARLLLPVAESLASLHAVSGSHGSLSPAAVRVDPDGRAVLVDAVRVPPDPAFLAPDQRSGPGPHPAADVWSFAAVLVFVTTGRTPPPDGYGGPYVGPRELGWLAPLVQLAIDEDPWDRPSMADVVDYLRARIPAPERGRASSLVLAGAGAAVIVGLGLVGALLLMVDPGGSGAPRSDERSSSAAPRPSEDEESAATSTASAERVTAAELERFARAYVRIASSDPGRGYRLLTPAYRSASPRYREVWSAIDAPRILRVVPDPAALSVSYTYRYSLPGGGQRTEDITLRLVERNGRLLIAGASAR